MYFKISLVIYPQGITDNKMQYFWKISELPLYFTPKHVRLFPKNNIKYRLLQTSLLNSWHSSVCSLDFYHKKGVTCFEVTVLSIMYALQCTHCTGSLLLEAMSGGSYHVGALLSYSRSSLAVGVSQPLPLAPTTIIITSLWDTQPLLLSAHATIF